MSCVGAGGLIVSFLTPLPLTLTLNLTLPLSGPRDQFAARGDPPGRGEDLCGHWPGRDTGAQLLQGKKKKTPTTHGWWTIYFGQWEDSQKGCVNHLNCFGWLSLQLSFKTAYRECACLRLCAWAGSLASLMQLWEWKRSWWWCSSTDQSAVDVT